MIGTGGAADYRRTISRAALVAAMAAGAAGWARAAEPASARGAVLEELVVTAEKREETLLNVSSSIQAVSGVELERRGLGDVRDVIKLTPGASLTSTVGAGFDTYQIRGINSGTQGEATVGFYLDDIAFSVPNVQVAPSSRLFDLERMEILRGPQGTLYGQGSMGGTIKIITAAPKLDAFQVKAAGTASRTEDGDPNYSADVALNIPIVRDRVALRLVGSYDKLGGVAEGFPGAAGVPAEYVGEKNLDGATTQQFRAKLRAALSDDLTVTASYWNTNIDQDFQRAYTPRTNLALPPTVEPPYLPATGGRRGFFKTNWSARTLAISYDLGFATLDSGTSYLRHHGQVRIGSLAGTRGIAGTDIDFHSRNVTEEVRLVSSGDGPFRWIVGGFYGDARNDSVNNLTLSALPTFVSINHALIKTTNWSVFGEVSYQLMGGRLVPLLGLRQAHEKRDLAQSLTSATGLAVDPLVSETYDTLNPRFNLSFHPNDDGQIYVNAAKGFRGGAVQTRASVSSAATFGIVAGTALPSDSLWTYEVGAKWRLFDGTLFADVAGYHTDWKDANLQFAYPAGAVLINVGDIKADGIDLGLQWRTPVPGLTAQFAGNHNKTKFVRPPTAATTNPSVVAGAQIPDVPRWTAALTLDFRPDVQVGAFRPFAYATYTYRSSQIGATTAYHYEALRDLGLRLGLRSDGLEVAGFVQNLLDKRGPVGSRGTNLLPQTPRVIGVSLAATLP